MHPFQGRHARRLALARRAEEVRLRLLVLCAPSRRTTAEQEEIAQLTAEQRELERALVGELRAAETRGDFA